MPASCARICSGSPSTARPTRIGFRAMQIGPAAEGAARGGRGFALLIVLWMLVLIGLIITHVTAVGRTEIRIATNASIGYRVPAPEVFVPALAAWPAANPDQLRRPCSR